MCFCENSQGGSQISQKPLSNTEEEEASSLGLKPSKAWKICSFYSHPGKQDYILSSLVDFFMIYIALCILILFLFFLYF